MRRTMRTPRRDPDTEGNGHERRKKARREEDYFDDLICLNFTLCFFVFFVANPLHKAEGDY